MKSESGTWGSNENAVQVRVVSATVIVDDEVGREWHAFESLAAAIAKVPKAAVDALRRGQEVNSA